MAALSAVAARRLPGFRFEAPPARLDEVLPRMDVAVFIGFAASGPLNRPVLVDSAGTFVDIFGGDLDLVWDDVRGQPLRAYLAPAVRAFFRNGGQRCWVIRVAGAAQSNQFPLPGIVVVQDHALSPGLAPARSEGSWSDSVRISAGLLIRPIAARSADLSVLRIEAKLEPDGLQVGDLIRLTFNPDGLLLMATIAGEIEGGLLLDQPAWFATATQTARGNATAILLDGRVVRVLNSIEEWGRAGAAVLKLAIPLGGAPRPGSIVQVHLGSEQFWFTVMELRGGLDAVDLTGQGLWWLPYGPDGLPPFKSDTIVERLTLQLWARSELDQPLQLNDLGFDSRHPRYWGGLPTDLDLFPALDAPVPARDLSALWREARLPRFPIAGPGQGLYLPLVVPSAPIAPLAPLASAATALERDGVDRLNADIFLDHAVADCSPAALLGEANFLRYESDVPRALTGIHAALTVDEATLISVPDVVHRGWLRALDESPPVTQLPIVDAAPTPTPRGAFECCATRTVPSPRLDATEPNPDGTFSLNWSSVPGAEYRLEEASDAQFDDADMIYAGPGATTTIYGHGQGAFFYRVRAVIGDVASDWSNGVRVAIRPPQRWLLASVADYSNRMLLAVHAALLRLCAAQGDLFAVLALPEHYREDEAIGHANQLGLDVTAASYGALYHPWLIGPVTAAPLEVAPPDGAQCGVAARRALSRGAWISPANEPLSGVVALSPALSRNRWLDLQTAQVNVVRQDPRGFLTLSADTLAADPEVRPINVRRLLQLLRRLALQRGTDYVFEPDSASFRRLVQRAFEQMLGSMLERGAFAGSTAAASFQVVTGNTVNPPESVDRGRLIVELRVAPSQPLAFLTVRLIQLPDGSLATREGM